MKTGRRRKGVPRSAAANCLAVGGFGPSLLHACARRPLGELSLTGSLDEQRKAAREAIPVCPGVYGWLNSDRTVLYIGKAKSLRHRLVGYFARETSDPKMARIRRQSASLVWEPVSDELLALIREQELIARYRPGFNVQGKPERRQPGYASLSSGVAPTVSFVSQGRPEGGLVVGPIPGRGELREAVISLNYVFGLRDCSDRTRMKFNNQLQLFEDVASAGCLRFELNSCLAPCAGACSKQEYDSNAERARQFLAGECRMAIEELEAQRDEAIDGWAFERAQVLNNQLRHLKWLERRLTQLRRDQKRLNGVWVLPGFDHQTHWMLLKGGRILGCAAGPEGDRERASESQNDLIQRLKSARQSAIAPPDDYLDTSLFLLLGAWRRRHPGTLKSLISFSTALSMLE